MMFGMGFGALFVLGIWVLSMLVAGVIGLAIGYFAGKNEKKDK